MRKTLELLILILLVNLIYFVENYCVLKHALRNATQDQFRFAKQKLAKNEFVICKYFIICIQFMLLRKIE